MADKALHFSKGKLGLDQLDPRVLIEDALVMNYGEFKYERDNWRKGTEYSEMLGSALRHIIAFSLGEDYDPETNLPHLAHARINLMFIRSWQLHDVGTDDRDVIPDNAMKHYRIWLETTIDTGTEQRIARLAQQEESK